MIRTVADPLADVSAGLAGHGIDARANREATSRIRVLEIDEDCNYN